MEVSLENKRLYVVMDVGTGGALGKNNALFDRALIEKKYPYTPSLRAPLHLYEESLKRGIQLITPDIYLGLDQKPKNTILLKDNIGDFGFSSQVIAAGVHPTILFAYENPLYMCQFFYNLEKNTQIYDHVFVPRGALSRVAKSATAHFWISPVPYRDGAPPTSFKDRKFLTMINGNARIQFLRRWYVHLWNVVKPFLSLVDRELYVDRLKAIEFFSAMPDFDLYGRHWDKPVRYTQTYDASIKRSYRGEVEDKYLTLSRYTFCLVFENCIFDGWVTEKIIDAMSAGCIPIYWGAPDITKYVPADCFIDFREFKNYKELDSFLREMDEGTFNHYQQRMHDFLRSEKYYEYFSKEKFVKEMIQIFESYS